MRMKKTEEIVPEIKGWKSSTGVISNCSDCGQYLDGTKPIYWQKVSAFKTQGAIIEKTRIVCRGCADK